MKKNVDGDRDDAKSLGFAYKAMASPLGELRLAGDERGLAAVLWEGERPNPVRAGATREDRNHPILVAVGRQLEEYFAGRRTVFDVPLNFIGTDFQKSVWCELLKIPFGETRTYGEIAARLGDRSKMRAVGAANGRNPIAVIAPCHRVIGASGDLVGFAAGLDIKAFPLDFERGNMTFSFAQPCGAR